MSDRKWFIKKDPVPVSIELDPIDCGPIGWCLHTIFITYSDGLGIKKKDTGASKLAKLFGKYNLPLPKHLYPYEQDYKDAQFGKEEPAKR